MQLSITSQIQKLGHKSETNRQISAIFEVLDVIILLSSGDFTKCSGQWLSGVFDRGLTAQIKKPCSDDTKKGTIIMYYMIHWRAR